jgi:hypothetical protein
MPIAAFNIADNRMRVFLTTLLDFLTYAQSKQAQTNTVFVQQKEMDRVGFEPTTSAARACQAADT